MRYRVIAIGPLKRGFYASGCAFYLARLSAYAKVEVLELPPSKAKDPHTARQEESAALLRASASRPSGYRVALDEAGEALTSRRLAETLSELELRGVSAIDLLVGGAEGHDEALRREVEASWSLSPLTLPHELARLVLLEQLYRAETIRGGHPYHRG